MLFALFYCGFGMGLLWSGLSCYVVLLLFWFLFLLLLCNFGVGVSFDFGWLDAVCIAPYLSFACWFGGLCYFLGLGIIVIALRIRIVWLLIVVYYTLIVCFALGFGWIFD